MSVNALSDILSQSKQSDAVDLFPNVSVDIVNCFVLSPSLFFWDTVATQVPLQHSEPKRQPSRNS